MSYLFQLLVVFGSQMFLTASKTVNLRNVVDNSIISAACSTAVVQTMWLISSTLGISALMNGDIVLLIAYVLGGIVGVIIVLKNKKS